MDPWKINIDTTKTTPGTFGKFHSNLTAHMANATTNAELTITLRVQLVPIKTYHDYLTMLPASWRKHVAPILPGTSTYPDYDKTAIEITSWTPGEWKTWMEGYKKQGEKAWHGKFWLQTPAKFTKFDLYGPGRKTYRPNVWCRFVLDVRDTKFPDGAHKVITVVNLKNKSDFFRSDDSSYDDQDLTPVDKAPGLKQVGAIHEIGHALGQDHIANLLDPTRCTPGSGATDCYGANAKEKANIMGSGMKVQRVNALPWVERAANHTGTKPADWKVFTHRVYPKPV